MEYNGSITLLPEGILSHSSCNRCRNSHIWADRDSNMCQTRHNHQLSSFSDSWPEYNVTKEAVCIVYRLSATHLQPHAARMPTECVSGSRLLLFAPEGSFLCEHPTGSRARLEWAPLRSAAPRQLAVWMWTWSLGPGVGGGGGGGGGWGGGGWGCFGWRCRGVPCHRALSSLMITHPQPELLLILFCLTASPGLKAPCSLCHVKAQVISLIQPRFLTRCSVCSD